MTFDISGAEKSRWYLDDLYAGLAAPQLDADISAFTQNAQKFNVTHKGALAQTLGAAINDYAELRMCEDKILLYLFLKQSLNVADAAAKAKIAAAEQKLSHASGEYLTFFHLELAALHDDELAHLYETDHICARHRPWIEHLRIFKPHLLSEPVESSLAKRAPFGPSAWSEFFDELESDIEATYRGEKKTLTELLHILAESPDADGRAEALRVIHESFNGTFAKYSAQTLYMVAGFAAVDQKERAYATPMAPRNKANRIPDDVVEALHAAVKECAVPLAKRYYRLKAAHLGLKTLRWSDRNAPMPFADTSVVPFEDAKKIVLAAYESFSPALAELIKEFFDQRHIDAPAVKGKRTGAFNYSVVLPGSKAVSYTLLNYLGSNRDVMTLAHELGHGVHGILAGRAQGVLMSQAPIAYAETASVFGEMTTFNFLKERLARSNDLQSLLALVLGKIDDSINTSVRQISFSSFERRVHGFDPASGEWHEPAKLSVQELNALWLESTREFYGADGEIFTYENTERLWAYISHFHSPFYVYGYALGEILTQSLYACRPQFGDRFEPLYLGLLSSGSTRKIVELLKPFGLNPKEKSFWTAGIETGLGKLLEEAEELSNKFK